MLRLNGSAFITGAGSGIGRGVALAFARYGVNRLALLDQRHDGLQETCQQIQKESPHTEMEIIPADVSNETSIQRAVSQASKLFNRIDYGVNCAGIAPSPEMTHEMTLKDWQKVIDVNLTGVWICQKHLLRQMLNQERRGDHEGRGAIINIASMYGLIAPPGSMAIAPYTASKHGVMGLTKTDAKIYAKKGIRINAICPGYIVTPLIAGSIHSGSMDNEFERTPVGRAGTVEEIADSIAFLASPLKQFH
ncbi:short chain dehydrogenase/reductase family oxidoreductase, partial [Penicillium hetheringtonii]